MPRTSVKWHQGNIAAMKDLKRREPNASACLLLDRVYKEKAQSLPHPIHPDRLVLSDPLVDHLSDLLSTVDRAAFLTAFFSSRTCVLLLHTPVLSIRHVPTSVNFFTMFGAHSPTTITM